MQCFIYDNEITEGWNGRWSGRPMIPLLHGIRNFRVVVDELQLGSMRDVLRL
jgi:hypothetical protein